MNNGVSISDQTKDDEQALSRLMQELQEQAYEPSILHLLPIMQDERDRAIVYKLINAMCAKAEAEARASQAKIDSIERQRIYADERHAMQGKL